MLYVLVLADLPKPEKGDTVIIASGPGDEPLAHAMGASAGLKTTTVLSGGHAHYELVSNGAPKRPSPMTATSLHFDAEVLRSLVPEAKIVVGSLQQNMPSVDWLVDPGGMIVDVRAHTDGQDEDSVMNRKADELATSACATQAQVK